MSCKTLLQWSHSQSRLHHLPMVNTMQFKVFSPTARKFEALQRFAAIVQTGTDAEALQALKDKGWKIYIFSTRTNKMFRKKDEEDQEVAMKRWLAEYEIPFDKIWTFGKPMADVYLDDRAIGFRGDWNSSLQEIENFVPWTKAED